MKRDARVAVPNMTATSCRVAALAAVLSAVTTLLLSLLPSLYARPQGFDVIVRLHQDPTYLARLWVNFAHIFPALFGYSVAAALLWRGSPALAGFGLICFLLWGFVELVGVSMSLFAVSFAWRAQFASASPEVRA